MHPAPRTPALPAANNAPMPRRPKNHRPDLNGLLVVDKPVGPTSMDVCRILRRATGGAKVGHAGTLNPLASGVLVVCLGSATRAIDSNHQNSVIRSRHPCWKHEAASDP